MDRAKLVTAIGLLANTTMPEAAWPMAFQAAGFDEGETYRAIAFVPVGLSRPLLEQLGVTNFADVASIPQADGDWLTVRLSAQPEYVAVVAAARDHFSTGSLPHEAFEAVVLKCSDVAAVSEALDAGVDIAGATIATAFHDPELAKHIIS